MPTYKCTLAFKFSNAGWTESHYRTAGNLQGAIDACSAWRVARRACLSQGVKLPYLRVDEVGIPSGNSRTIELAEDGASSLSCDAPWTGPLYRLRGEDGHGSRQLCLRGIPDDWIAQSGDQIVLTPPAKTICDLYATFLQAFGWGMLVKPYTAPIPEEKVITGLTITDPFVTLTAAGHGLQAGFLVALRALKGITGVPRIVQVVDTPTVDTLKIFAPAAYGVYGGGGRVRKSQYEFLDYTGFEYIRVSKRDVGRPFAPYRGSH